MRDFTAYHRPALVIFALVVYYSASFPGMMSIKCRVSRGISILVFSVPLAPTDADPDDLGPEA